MSKEKQNIAKETKTPKEIKKRSQLMSVFTREYKHEGLILLVLALVALVLGLLLIFGTLNINPEVFLLGDYPLVFAWVLVGLGFISFILAVWPFYKPSIEELKRVSWISRGTLLKDSLTVFIFVLILSGFFAVSNLGFTNLTDWLLKVGGR